MGFLHRQCTRLRLRNCPPCPPRCLHGNSADELVHRLNHRRRCDVCLQQAQRPVGLACAFGPAMGLSREFLPTSHNMPTMLTPLDPPPNPRLPRPGIPMVAHPPRPQGRSPPIHRASRHRLQGTSSKVPCHDGAYRRDRSTDRWFSQPSRPF